MRLSRQIMSWLEGWITWLVSLIFKEKFDRKKYHFNLSEMWYSPWDKDEEFNSIYSAISGNTLLAKRKLFDLYKISKQVNLLGGDYLEVGTFRGGTAALLASTFTNEKFILWDNWGKNVSKNTYFIEKVYSENDDLNNTKNLLNNVSTLPLDNIVFIDEPFPNIEIISRMDTQLALVHFDIYDRTAFVDSIDLLWPKLQIGGVFIVSAYGAISLDPLTSAVNEFVKNQIDCLFIQSQSGLGLLLKRN